MKSSGFKRFVCRSLVALLPVAAFVALYLVRDPFGVVHRYNGISIAPGDTLERIPNKRYVAVEGLKFYDPDHNYDSFIFGSSISSNFSAEAWKKHLPDSARVYHFTAGAETLTGVRDELDYLIRSGYKVRHALLVIEEEMLRRPKRYEEMPYVPHYDVSSEISWLHFQRVHFNAFRDPYMFFYQFWPTSRVVNILMEDAKLTTIPEGRDESINEDSYNQLDSTIVSDPDAFYADKSWLVEMQPTPDPMPLSIDAATEQVLNDIARLLRDNHVDYVVLVPPRFRSQPLSVIDRGVLCDIFGDEHVNDFSNDSVLIHDLHSYYDGIHILTYRCSQLIDSCYQRRQSPLSFSR
jgi:hypothetical protein